jgi:hypothetical protein
LGANEAPARAAADLMKVRRDWFCMFLVLLKILPDIYGVSI